MINILLRLILSQFKIFFREPGVVFWSFGFPLLMAWILGIAFANKGNTLHIVAVVDDIFLNCTRQLTVTVDEELERCRSNIVFYSRVNDYNTATFNNQLELFTSSIAMIRYLNTSCNCLC